MSHPRLLWLLTGWHFPIYWYLACLAITKYFRFYLPNVFQLVPTALLYHTSWPGAALLITWLNPLQTQVWWNHSSTSFHLPLTEVWTPWLSFKDKTSGLSHYFSVFQPPHLGIHILTQTLPPPLKGLASEPFHHTATLTLRNSFSLLKDMFILKSSCRKAEFLSILLTVITPWLDMCLVYNKHLLFVE